MKFVTAMYVYNNVEFEFGSLEVRNGFLEY